MARIPLFFDGQIILLERKSPRWAMRAASTENRFGKQGVQRRIQRKRGYSNLLNKGMQCIDWKFTGAQCTAATIPGQLRFDELLRSMQDAPRLAFVRDRTL